MNEFGLPKSELTEEQQTLVNELEPYKDDVLVARILGGINKGFYDASRNYYLSNVDKFRDIPEVDTILRRHFVASEDGK